MHRFVAALLLAAIPTLASAASLAVELHDEHGAAVPGTVAWAVPDGRKPAPPARTAILDQRNRQFVPHILVVQTGTAVRFPNSDNVRHQVYSFSPAKKFQLPLYEGTPAAPVVFDKPGIVALGCNIHDGMSAYVIVVDTPYFVFAESGTPELSNLPDGKYVVHVWYEGMRTEPPPQTVTLTGNEYSEVRFSIDRK